MTRPTTIPKSAKMTQNNHHISLMEQAEDAILRFALRHRRAFCALFRFVDTIPYRIVGLLLVWLGVKFAEVGYNATTLIDRDFGTVAVFLIPMGVFFLVYHWRKN